MGNQSQVRRNFGQRATDYRLSSTHGDPVDLERMINLIKPNPGAIALDIATGGGHTAIALAKYVNRVLAIDITPEMLAEAKAAAKQLGISNIEFQVEDVHKLNIADEQFDIVATRFAAHHFYDIKKALGEMCRVLKSGGQLYILDCTVQDGDEPETKINRIEFLRDSSHHCSYSPRQWMQLLKELPVTVQHSSLLKNDYKLPQWFDRMATDQNNQQEIFSILNSLSEEYKALYPFSENYITTYRFEVLAFKH